MKHKLLGLFVFLSMQYVFAGNPDRQGESGASELLLNPWARSAGLQTMSTSFITGVEALRLNPAGLVHIRKTQLLIGHTLLYNKTGVRINAAGLATKISDHGAFGVSLMAMDFGDIPVTTTQQPEGTGATFSPNFFHIGIAYAHEFENKVSVGATIRLISESTSDISAQGVAIDAGVQYVTGDQDNFKFGISLRNTGTPMSFAGEGLSLRFQNPDGNISYPLTYDKRAARFELPSVLNIGASYNIIVNPKHNFIVLGNFTSNSFSRDQIGGGLEYSFNNILQLRAAYQYEMGYSSDQVIKEQVYTGLSAGFSLQVPMTKDKEKAFGIDYAFRATNPWEGTHSLTVRLDL